MVNPRVLQSLNLWLFIKLVSRHRQGFLSEEDFSLALPERTLTLTTSGVGRGAESVTEKCCVWEKKPYYAIFKIVECENFEALAEEGLASWEFMVCQITQWQLILHTYSPCLSVFTSLFFWLLLMCYP